MDIILHIIRVIGIGKNFVSFQYKDPGGKSDTNEIYKWALVSLLSPLEFVKLVTKHLSTYMMTIWNVVFDPRKAENRINTGAILMTKEGLTFGPTYRSNVLESF
jgi:hypothetical protein